MQQNPHAPPTGELLAPPDERPTAVRYAVLFWLCTLALLLYIDRVCIGQAADTLSHDLKLSNTQLSWINIAFIISYCVFEVPTGHWGDRFGSRRVIARIVVWWSICTALTGAAFGLWSLLAIRFIFGAGEAGAFPNAARVVTRWFPQQERGLARGAITTTSQLGASIAMPLSASLIELVGWRWMFAIFGTLGLVWAGLFYWWYRDDPSEHPAVNRAERELIGTAGPAPHEHLPIPWSNVVKSPNVWLMGTIMAVGATLFYLLFSWYSKYLKNVHQITEQNSGWLTGLVIAGGALGCIAGGVVSDLVIRRTSERRWTRRLVGAGMLLLSALSMGCFRFCDHPLATTLCCAASLFFLQVSIPTWWTVVAEISGPHGAAMFGLMNGLGGVGILTMNLLVGPVVDARVAAKVPPLEVWRPVFDGVALALACGAVCWLFVDATRSIVATNQIPNPQSQT